MPRRGAPDPVPGAATVEPHTRLDLDLSPEAPLAALARERCPGALLARPSPDFGIDWTLMLPRSAATAVQVHTAVQDHSGRVHVTVRDVPRLEQFLRAPHRAMLLAVEEDAPMPRIYGLDAAAVRRQLTERSRAGVVPVNHRTIALAGVRAARAELCRAAGLLRRAIALAATQDVSAEHVASAAGISVEHVQRIATERDARAGSHGGTRADRDEHGARS